MKACKYYQKHLSLYVYGELNPVQRADVEAHIQLCGDCREALSRLQALQQLLPAQSPELPEEATMTLLRNAVSRRLRAGDPAGAGWGAGLRSLLYPAPLLRIGFAALVFLVGLLIGRQSGPAAAPGADLQQLFSAGQAVQAGEGAISPLLAGVEKIRYHPESGDMEIFYTTVNDVYLKGDLHNPAVRSMLREALLEEESPSVRLHAVKVVKSLAEKRQSIDPDLVSALVYLLQKEPNAGVRLKVIETLKALLPDENVKYTLVNILLDDPNPAMRIEALGALAGNLRGEDIDIFRRIAREDSNSFIRTRSSEMVREYDAGNIPGAGNE